jgi:hypothetical protein
MRKVVLMLRDLEGVMFIENIKGLMKSSSVTNQQNEAHMLANPATIFKLSRERNQRLSKEMKGTGEKPKTPSSEPSEL